MKTNTSNNHQPTHRTMTNTHTTTPRSTLKNRAEDAKELLQEEQEEATLVHLTDRAFLKLKALEGYEQERPEDV
jgi:hypothetical protein